MHHSGLSQPSSAGEDNAANRMFVNAGIGLQRSTSPGVEPESVNRRSSPQSKY